MAVMVTTWAPVTVTTDVLLDDHEGLTLAVVPSVKVATVVMLVVSPISKSAPETLGEILSTGFCVELGAVGEPAPPQATNSGTLTASSYSPRTRPERFSIGRGLLYPTDSQ